MRKIQNEELNRLSVEDFKQSHKEQFIILLDSVRSMNNVGSAFRTADAFRCKSVVLCGITATPPHREIHKTALGAEESVDWIYENKTEDAINRLKSEGYLIVAVEQIENGISLNNFKPEKGKKYAYIFGNEITGVSEEAIKLCDLYIDIPQQGTKHSLNVAVSIGIVSWHHINCSLI